MLDRFCSQEGIIIPPGYQILDPSNQTDLASNFSDQPSENPSLKNQIDGLRFSYKHQIAYLFNPGHPEYQKFLEICRAESNDLSRALRSNTEIQRLQVWPTRNARPTSKKHFRRVELIFRPPFFRSAESKNDQTRMQRDNHNDLFVLHVDESHYLQTVRWWSVPQSDSDQFHRNVFRHFFSAFLAKDRDFFQQHYGQWDIYAGRVAEHLVNCLEIEKRSLKPPISEP